MPSHVVGHLRNAAPGPVAGRGAERGFHSLEATHDQVLVADAPEPQGNVDTLPHEIDHPIADLHVDMHIRVKSQELAQQAREVGLHEPMKPRDAQTTAWA
ncbi:hypothetical protein D9M68_914900 [compost metagenome]